MKNQSRIESKTNTTKVQQRQEEGKKQKKKRAKKTELRRWCMESRMDNNGTRKIRSDAVIEKETLSVWFVMALPGNRISGRRICPCG